MAGKADFVVRLIDRLTAPAKKATASIEKMGRAARTVDKAVNKSTKTYRDASGRLRGLSSRFVGSGRAAAKAGRGTSFFSGSLQHMVGDIKSRAVQAIAELTVRLGHASIELVTFGQNMGMAFDRLAKHGASGNKIFEHTKDLAEELGLDVMETSKAYSKFLALQFNPRQADDLIKLGADMRVLGATSEDVKGIWLQLGQIKSLGKAQMEELRPIMERGVSGQFIFEAIAKRMDVDTSKVPDLISAGKVTADVAIPSIQEALVRKLQTKELGEAGKKFADETIDGMAGQVKAKGQRVGLELAKQVTPAMTALVGDVLERLDRFIKSDEGQQFFRELGENLVRFIEGIERAIPKLEAFIGGFGSGLEQESALGKIADAIQFVDEDQINRIERMGKAIGELTGHIIALVEAAAKLSEVAFAVNDFVSFDAPGSSLKEVEAKEDKSGGFDFKGRATVAAKQAVNSLTGIVLPGVTIFDMFGKGEELGTALSGGLAMGIKDGSGAAAAEAKRAGQEVVGQLQSTLETHSPSRVTKRLGGFVTIGLGKGIESKTSLARRSAHRSGLEVTSGFMAGAQLDAALKPSFDVDSLKPELAGHFGGLINARSLGRETPREFHGPKRISDDLNSIQIDRPQRPERLSQDSRGSRGSRAAPPITVNITVNASGASEPRDIADDIGDALELRLNKILHRLNEAT